MRVKTIFLIECFKEEIQYDLFLLLLGMCTFKYDARFAECWKIELAGMNFIYNITGMNAESNML